jgi:serine/threonine-protein kinase
VLSRDADYTIKKLGLYEGTQNITISCLAVPDAFLAHQDYVTALSEYRRIGYAFPGRMEGREALFRAGITLLEQANKALPSSNALPLYDLALAEFEKLHKTPGAPLEYLGKGLVYQAMHDSEEEIKCFELAYRRYPKHPLLHVLQEQIITRMHEISRTDRYTAYQFILLAVQHIPEWTQNQPVLKLVLRLERHWEPLPFIEHESATEETRNFIYGIPLAFWLAKPYLLEEMIDALKTAEKPSVKLLGNALMALIALEKLPIVTEKLRDFEERGLQIPGSDLFRLTCREDPLEEKLKGFTGHLEFHDERILNLLLKQALDQTLPNLVHATLSRLEEPLSLNLICLQIWASLSEQDFSTAGELLHQFPFEWHTKETSLLHFLYGCWLLVTEGKELAMIHFSGILEVPYPRTWTLASHFLIGKLPETWFKKAFLYEKKELYRQLVLFYTLAKEEEKAEEYRQLRDGVFS